MFFLDEPTNDLDIGTLTVLGDYLDRFRGIVAVVSHDRYFLDRTVRRVFAFGDDGKLRRYEGGYTDYALRKSREEEEAASKRGAAALEGAAATARGPGETVKEKTVRKDGGARKLKFTFREQKEYETIEADIAGLEEKIARPEPETSGKIWRAKRPYSRRGALHFTGSP